MVISQAEVPFYQDTIFPVSQSALTFLLAMRVDLSLVPAW